MAAKQFTGEERAHVALEASWQISGLFLALARYSEAGADQLEESAVMKAFATRGQALACAQMSMLGDDLAKVEDARRVINGDSEGESEDNHE